MGTVNIVFAGFSALPATAPTGWPSGLVWPGAVTPNGSRQSTITDADLLSLITWIAGSQNAALNAGPASAPNPVTLGQLLNAWAAMLFASTRADIQRYFAAPATVPPPIGLN